MKEQVIPGIWRLDDNGEEYNGKLIVNSSESLLLLEIITDSFEWPGCYEASTLFKPIVITGETFEKTMVALVDCILVSAAEASGNESRRNAKYTIRARCAFWDVVISKRSDLAFGSAQIDYGDIVSWANMSQYEPFFESNVSGVTWAQKPPVRIPYDDRANVEIAAFGEMTPYSNNAKTCLTQGVNVRMTYSTPATWESVLDDATCLAQLMSFGRREHVGIHEIEFSPISESNIIAKGVGKDYLKSILPLRDKRTHNSVHSAQYLFTLDQLLEVDGLTAWFKHYSKLKPIIDLYLLVYTDRIGTSEGYFLNLVQALEGFHKRFVADSIKEYEVRFRSLLDNVVPKDEQDDYEKQFLGKGKDKADQVYLRMRLLDLLYASGYRPFISNMDDCERFVRKVTTTRHYYTHYDLKKQNRVFSPEFYPGINEMLMAILEYHIMILLGFDESYAAQKAVGGLYPDWHQYYLSEACLGETDFSQHNSI